jgi:hypothetical protein
VHGVVPPLFLYPHPPAPPSARQLVAAGFPDRPMVIRYRGLAGTMAYRLIYPTAGPSRRLAGSASTATIMFMSSTSRSAGGRYFWIIGPPRRRDHR